MGYFNARTGDASNFMLEIWDTEQDYFYLKYKMRAPVAKFDTSSNRWLLYHVVIRENFTEDSQTLRTVDQLDTALSFRPSDIIKYYDEHK